MERDTRDFGKTIGSMDRAQKLGLMGRGTRANMCLARNMAKELSTGQMEAHIKVSLLTITSKVKEFINGLTFESLMETGRTTKCMVEVFSPGQTEGFMKASILTTRNRGMASSFGLMAEGTKVAGSRVSSMARELTSAQRDKLERVFGKTESG